MEPEARPELLRFVGDRVRARREARHLTRRGLAERSGLSERFLAQLEAGAGNISLARLHDVARALGVTLEELVTGYEAHAARGRLVALLGLRGAGKSTLGGRLATELGVPFHELDQLVEQRAGMTLGEIFELHGEAYFRRVERDALGDFLAELGEEGAAVLATSGSLPADPETFGLLARRARTVWLRARPEEHFARVRAQGDHRPMAERPHAMEELRALLAAREPLYARAEITIDTSALGEQGSLEALTALFGRAEERRHDR